MFALGQLLAFLFLVSVGLLIAYLRATGSPNIRAMAAICGLKVARRANVGFTPG